MIEPDASTWPRWQRVLFRYLCLHWLLYAFPGPLSSLFGTVVFWLGRLGELLQGLLDRGVTVGEGIVEAAEKTGAAAGPASATEAGQLDLTSWSEPVSEWIGRVGGEGLDAVHGGPSSGELGWWRELTTWVGTKAGEWTGGGWSFEVFHQPTGSGDTMHDWVKLACIVAAAGFLTILWSLLDRSRSYPRLGRWLHLGARWYLALPLLGYGMAKFYGATQLAEPGIFGLTREIGDHSPMGLVWTFMGASTPYKYLSGAGELLGFALLLHRRTVLLGCFVTVAVMGNVCALNWLYGVPVKIYSTHLLLIALLLMAPFKERLWALFVSNRFSESVELRVVRARWLGWPLLLIGWLWAVGVVWQGHEGNVERMEDPRTAASLKKPELFGLWQVESMKIDGVDVPMSDSSRWEFLAIDKGDKAWGRTLAGTMHQFDITEDLPAGLVTMQPSGSETGEVWTIERSTVTRKVRNPRPRTREEFRTPTDGERQAILWKGTWDGRELELFTVQKVFRVHDAFRLVREFPR